MLALVTKHLLANTLIDMKYWFEFKFCLHSLKGNEIKCPDVFGQSKERECKYEIGYIKLAQLSYVGKMLINYSFVSLMTTEWHIWPVAQMTNKN